MSIFNVERDAVPVGLLGNQSTTLTVVSGDTLYYADNSQVSSTSNQGSLTSGNSATFTENVWIVSASASSVSQSFTAAPTGGGGSGASPNTTVASSGASQTLTAPSTGEASYDITLSANCAVTLAGGSSGNKAALTVLVRQPAAGGPWTITWPTNLAWASQSPPPQTATPSAYDVYTIFTVTGGATWTGVLSSSAVLANAAPGAPTGLTATPGAGQVTLNWTAPANNGGFPITAYKLLRSTTTGTETLYQTLGNVITYTDTGVVNGTTYFYEVQAVNTIGTGAASSEVSAAPLVPFVNDTFAGTAATLLTAAHSGQVTGATWTAHPTSTGADPIITNANRLRSNTTGAQEERYYASGTKVSADYTVQTTIRVLTEVNNTVVGVLGRMDATVATYYSARYNVGSGGAAAKFELYKFVSGTATLLGTYVTEMALNTDHILALAMTGTTIALQIDGTTQISATDSAITASGRVGVNFFQPATDTTGVQLSNYTAT